ncbi:hypothetical protein PUNSTDRAFT_137373 [Punctularia strigosozonata HHB-11173 SS5]|uniref:uncharacterized protein n=1 Tax=Punctularia strigosozonata (strain HHB-11173) TaxID=741275 RepID=UPI0004417833|nr:uncharacterized protein PUNSTDRAFT_137373 [Punctularia strigosozonata HHB-11173 SS5]EIN05888.1 hypothetical protein PUNSTDRAFT_137373 [Punctularia strigosozonata HHB-11173 SS5]
MSKAKTNKGKKAGGDVEADDVKFSQRTVSSGDESGVKTEQFPIVHWNKKKKDKEARFIELLEQELRTTLKLGVEEYSESVAEL